MQADARDEDVPNRTLRRHVELLARDRVGGIVEQQHLHLGGVLGVHGEVDAVVDEGGAHVIEGRDVGGRVARGVGLGRVQMDVVAAGAGGEAHESHGRDAPSCHCKDSATPGSHGALCLGPICSEWQSRHPPTKKQRQVAWQAQRFAEGLGFSTLPG